jgi:drug/metabolite transporter (DMT)-like permease
VPGRPNNLALSLSLVFAIALWGGNNTGTRFVVAVWPPVWTGASRFFCAGLLLSLILRFQHRAAPRSPLSPSIRTRLWLRGGLSLAAYIVSFNWALRYTTASHVALYLGASPVWALLWEGLPGKNWASVKRYAAAALALAGIVVLFWPALQRDHASWFGELLGLLASILWTNYGRQCRSLSSQLSGAELTAHTMWRAGLWLAPLAAVELYQHGLPWRNDVALVQLYCIFAGGLVAFGIWNNALRHWPASQVLLFNNLIPLSTMTWAHFWLKEPITPTFWLAMVLVVIGVLLSQVNWQQLIAPRAIPAE